VDLAMLGPADQSGGWQAWEAFNAAGQHSSQEPFLIDTDDQRLCAETAPDGCTTDGLYFEYRGNAPFRPERGIYHFSHYGDARWRPYNDNSFVGDMDEIIVEEMDLLIAEAELRAGANGAAVAIINKTRTAHGGLPEATESGVSGARCVPRTASGSCGSLWDALKHEKRFEVWHHGMGIAFFDDRGWGDLRSNTPIHFPVPAKELQVLLQEIYTFGGGGEGSAPNIRDDITFDFSTLGQRAENFRKINKEGSPHAPAAWVH
jgi:hypothetical protein